MKGSAQIPHFSRSGKVCLPNHHVEHESDQYSWSNHGPRIRANHYLIRFWEPPASRIFNQLLVERVLSR
jgi:hypothetical protein